jgi:ribosomal protein L30
LPVKLHLDLLSQLAEILPENCRAVFLGDGEFDGIELQSALQALGLRKIRQTVEQQDTPQLRGMLAKVRHMVHVEDVASPVRQEKK